MCSAEPLLDGFRVIYGTDIAKLLSLLAVIGLIASFHTIIFAFGRQIYSLSRAGYYPAFMSITHGGRRIRVETSCPDDDPHVPSLVELYPANDWHERETWDMFGIIFDGHPALTRILMPDDWPGHPQRKDYPLGGIPVEYKGATIPAPDTRRSYS